MKRVVYPHRISLWQKIAYTVLPLGLLLIHPINAAEHATDPEGQRCISATRIDNTEIIDDQTVVFHLRGNESYVNRLPNRCPGMRIHQTIAYKTQTSQLCRVDTITVLHTTGGITRGPRCGLGMFVPITKEEVRALKNPEAAEEAAGEEASESAQ